MESAQAEGSGPKKKAPWLTEKTVPYPGKSCGRKLGGTELDYKDHSFI